MVLVGFLLIYRRKAPDVKKAVDVAALRMFKRLLEGDPTSACVVGGDGKSRFFPLGILMDTPSSATHASLSTASSSKASAMSNTSSNDTRPWVSVVAYLWLFVPKTVFGKSTRYTSSTTLSTLAMILVFRFGDGRGLKSQT